MASCFAPLSISITTLECRLRQSALYRCSAPGVAVTERQTLLHLVGWEQGGGSCWEADPVHLKLVKRGAVDGGVLLDLLTL